MIAATVLGVLALLAQDPPLPAHGLRVVVVDEATHPAEYASDTAEVSQMAESRLMEPPSFYNQYMFLLTESGAQFELGKETEGTDQLLDPAYGMDPETLEVQWAQPGTILTVSWKTHSIAQGRNIVEGFVVLEKQDNKWREVFRDYHDHFYRSGWAYNSEQQLSLRYEPPTGLLLVLSEKSFNALQETWPLSRAIEHMEGWYGATLTVVSEWPCHVEDGHLTCGEGLRFLDVGEETFPLEEAARYILGIPSIDDEAQRAAVNAELARLRELNPQLANAETFTGRIKTQIVAPYQPHQEYRWRM